MRRTINGLWVKREWKSSRRVDSSPQAMPNQWNITRDTENVFNIGARTGTLSDTPEEWHQIASTSSWRERAFSRLSASQEKLSQSLDSSMKFAQSLSCQKWLAAHPLMATRAFLMFLAQAMTTFTISSLVALRRFRDVRDSFKCICKTPLQRNDDDLVIMEM